MLSSGILAGCSQGMPATPTKETESPTINETLQPQQEQDPSLDAEVIFGWEFAQAGKALGWVPTHDLRLFSADSEGLHTGSTGGDPYMVGPSIAINAVTAPYLAVRMRSDKGSDAQVFWEVEGAAFNEPASLHFTVTPDNKWHTYVIPLKSNANWTSKITHLRLDPSNNSGSEITIAYIRLLGPFPAKLSVTRLGAQRAIIEANAPFRVHAVVVNTGDIMLDREQLTFAYPKQLNLIDGMPLTEVSALAPGEAVTLTWTLQGPAGAYAFKLNSETAVLKQGSVVIENKTTNNQQNLANNNIRITFAQQPYGYGIGTVEWYDGVNWRIAGRLRSLGEIRYLDNNLAEHRVLLYAQNATSADGELAFTSNFTDEDGTTWTSNVVFRLNAASMWFDLEYKLTTDHPVRLKAWTGPEYLAGEGSFGETRESGLFPGLEYLMGNESSSGTDFADPAVAARYVPNPNKITIPLMAVTADGMTTGLMWDPLDKWDLDHDRPAALYASPNSWQGQANHLMSLFVPGMTAGLLENTDEVNDFYTLQPDKPLTLKAMLFASAASDPLVALDIWLLGHELPQLPSSSTDLATGANLCLDAYLTTAYDSVSKGWHYALADPWGPGPSAANALHLELSSFALPKDSVEANLLQQVARSSTDALGTNGGPNPWYYQTTLALLRGDPASKVLEPYISALTIAQSQLPNGSWSYTPQERTGRAFGTLGDTSSGWVATKALPVIYEARLTRNQTLVDASIKALDFLLNLPLRPEGAQTWELPLHVPDLLASSWVTQVFVEGYKLTGDTKYLDAAQRWAMAGLPFIYMWSAPDRPIMSYATVPVFGATNYNYPWFGKPVMWNGLDYAIGLHDLSASLDTAGIKPSLDWRKVAEGITIATLQMQATEGQFKGMYPDAWDVVTGEEAYSWWLIPSYLMQNILLVQGVPQAEVTSRIVTDTQTSLTVTSVDPAMSASLANGTLTVELGSLQGDSTSVLISPVTQLPSQIIINGVNVEVNTGWSNPTGAWQWTSGILLVKIPNNGTTKSHLEIVFRN
ncbi:MAG: hypothetical protein ACYC6L_16770 [Anaerolineae bacterium]